MTISASEAKPVSLPLLARELGITDGQRAEILRDRLVTPVGGFRQGAATLITPESAWLLREAKRIVDVIRKNPVESLAVGVSLVIVLRLLLSGAVKPGI